MKPEWRPISLTRPTPLGDALASTSACADRLRRFAEGGLEAEALVDEGDVVVDRLGNAHYGDLLAAAPATAAAICIAAADASVAANDEQGVDVHPLQAIDDFTEAPGCPGRCRGSCRRPR